MSKLLSEQELKREIYPLYFTGDSLMEVWLPEEKLAHEKSKLKTDELVKVIQSQKTAAVDDAYSKTFDAHLQKYLPHDGVFRSVRFDIKIPEDGNLEFKEGNTNESN